MQAKRDLFSDERFSGGWSCDPPDPSQRCHDKELLRVHSGFFSIFRREDGNTVNISIEERRMLKHRLEKDRDAERSNIR